jgi:hypothetical protein
VEGRAIPEPARRRKSLLGRGWKRFGESRAVRRALGSAAASYIRLVGATSRLIYEGSVDYDTFDLDRPVIITMWHGQHLMLPAVRRKGHKVVALISRHRDGDLNAIVAEKLGVETVRGSAARERSRVVERGGISGFMKLRTALREGKSVTLTADLSRVVARRAGVGIVQLARASGVPIAPIALASSRRRVVNSWDHTTVSLPFGRIAMVVGDFISVPTNAGDDELEGRRLALERELNRITERANALADRRNG